MPTRISAGPAVQALASKGWVCQQCRFRSLQASNRLLHYASPPSRARVAPRPSIARSQNSSRGPTSHIRGLTTSISLREAPKRLAKLPDQPARTRFAPSPTGFLHIGGLRTALFSYLLAKRTGGQFLLRVEDTDQKRLVPGAEDRLFDDLHWAGLQWDEGPQIGGPYGPYKQSERTHIYQQHAHLLLDSGAAYRCFCTPQTVGQGMTAYVTSGCYQDCAALPHDQAHESAQDAKQPFTVRLKRPEGVNKRVYPDLIYGKITPLKRSPAAPASVDAESGAVDAADTILIKSDGTPTYHFANVVDDHLMQITHVIRGTEWMASTPLHYDLYHAFQWTPPAFAHVGLLVDEKKAKLSKRNADLALDVQSMRDEHGVLPETLVNFLALLGWSNPTGNDVLDMQQLISIFDLKFTKGNTMVRMEKLWYLQKQHVAARCLQAREGGSMEPIQDLASGVSQAAVKRYPAVQDYFTTTAKLQQYCADILLADSKAYQNAGQYVERNRYFFAYDVDSVPAPQEFYDKEKQISAQEVGDLVREVLVEFGKPHEHRPANEVFAALLPELEDTAERQIGEQMNYGRERVAAGDGANSNASTPESVKRRPWFGVINDRIHEALDYHIAVRISTVDLHTIQGAKREDQLTKPQLLTDEEKVMYKEAIVRVKKGWNTALMRYLREKLGYGLPGPSIGVVMAVLGYEECCRRVGVEVIKGRGW